MEESCQFHVSDRFVSRKRAYKPFNSGLCGTQGPFGHFDGWGGGPFPLPAGNRTTNPRMSGP
jgi:hypothetical protein